MTAALVMRDLTLLTRRPGVIAAGALHAAFAAAFLVAWAPAGRMPLLDGDSLYAQLLTIQWTIAALVAPWLTARLMADERGDAWSRLSALTGCTPSRLLAVRAAVVAVGVVTFVFAALPAVLLARQMAPAAAGALAWDQVQLIAFALGVAGITLHVELTVERRLASWMVSTAAGVVAATIANRIGFGAASVAAAAVCLIATAVLMRRADKTLWHMKETGR